MARKYPRPCRFGFVFVSNVSVISDSTALNQTDKASIICLMYTCRRDCMNHRKSIIDMCGQKGYLGKQCMLVNVVLLYDMKWNSDQWYTSTRLVWSSTGSMLSLSINVLMLILLRYSSFPKYYFRYVLSLKHSNMTFSWNV